MYIPSSFNKSDPKSIKAIVEKFSFATVIASSEGSLEAAHVPILYDPSTSKNGSLFGHVANANPILKLLEKGDEILTIFQGPHGYVSPSWYESDSVPTWNYISIHVYGRAKIFNDDRLVTLLTDLTHKYESSRQKPWVFDPTPKDKQVLLKMITGFEIKIERIQSKFKLNQNKSQADRDGVIAALKKDPTENNLAIAEWMLKA